MNLQQTINELEAQAAQYTEAAKNLRALLQQGTTSAPASQPKAASKAASKTASKAAPKKAAAKSAKKAGKKSGVSAETRAKISEALRASHAARKAKAG